MTELAIRRQDQTQLSAGGARHRMLGVDLHLGKHNLAARTADDARLLRCESSTVGGPAIANYGCCTYPPGTARSERESGGHRAQVVLDSSYHSAVRAAAHDSKLAGTGCIAAAVVIGSSTHASYPAVLARWRSSEERTGW